MPSAQTPRPGETLDELLDEIPPDLARQAFSHASWTKPRSDSYERLAYLGDTVLELAVSTHLYPLVGEYGVGRLTKVRARSVSEPATVEVALELGLDRRLMDHAPKREQAGLEQLLASERVLSSVCEAAIGAVYLGLGYERVAPAVVQAFAKQIERALEHSDDSKSMLQERMARRASVVDYEVMEESGPPHDRSFVIAALVEGRELGRGEGRTKKLAEQMAAEQALEKLGG